MIDEGKLLVGAFNDGYKQGKADAVKHGKWERTDAYPHRIYCSRCYKTYISNDEWLERWEFPMNFCPECGADMRGEA